MDEQNKKRNTLSSELSWPHYRLLMRIDEPKRHGFYLSECVQRRFLLDKDVMPNEISV